MASRRVVEYEVDDFESIYLQKRNARGGPGGVSFQPKLSVYSVSGVEDEFDLLDQNLIEEEDVEPIMEQKKWWIYLTENQRARQIFRAVSVVNLLVLVFSIPFYNLSKIYNSEKSEDYERQQLVVCYQFYVVTGLDFILACAYTFNLIIRITYYCYIKRERKQRSLSTEQEETSQNYADGCRLFTALLLTMSVWYSVALGIYRSIDSTILWWWYLGYAPRAILAVFPVLNLLLNMESSAMNKLSKIFKWKQLAMVTMFYFIFVFIFALMGVHIIGGLDYACVYKTLDEDGNYSTVPALPLVHCSPSDNKLHFCAQDGENVTGLVCAKFPPRDDKPDFFFNYRSFVYYGQFRTILDALYAVYEASTLELWSLMQYTAIEGRGLILPVLFYFLLVLFLVMILQQSIFLVVIIESFADLRDKSFFWKSMSSSQKHQNKPSKVLSLHDQKTNTLHLKSLEEDSSVAFLEKYSSILVKLEKVFLVLVIIDAIITATKHAEMTGDTQRRVLQVWQITVSVLFVIEIVFLFFFHLYHGQWKLFLHRPYYLCLVVLAVGGLVAAIPYKGFYDPFLPGSGLVIFQALRFPRLLRLSQTILDFTLKIVGKSIPILSVITVVIICWLSVFNGQIFGHMTDYPDECRALSGQHFGTFYQAFLATFQLVMNEAWTDVTSEVMCHSKLWFLTNLYFIVIHLFSSLIFLNFFGAVILDNLEYDEEEKKAKLEEIKKKEAEFGESVPSHLKIFEKLGNQPKKLKPPPGTGGEDPNLDEVEVRKFFDSATTSNLVVDPLSHNTDLSSFHTRSPNNKRISKLHQLSLVSSANYDLMPCETEELHGKYTSVSAILNYIKLWRKYSEEENSKNPRSSHIHYLFGQSPYERKTQPTNHCSNNAHNEYEVFKEKHRFFDMSLFCMPPEHKLRKFCTRLLTAQMEAPRYVLIEGKGGIFQIFKKRISFIFRWLISRLPYFTWIMLLSLWVIITVQLEDFAVRNGHKHAFNLLVEVVYVSLMFTWLILNIISRGCFLNPNAAINSVWDVIDWILVLHSGALLALLPLWLDRESIQVRIEIDIPFLPIWVWYLFIMRSLRPLQALSILNPLRAVVREIVEGWKNLLKAVVIMVAFMFMFASLGVQLFAGTDENPLAFCNDPSVDSRRECVGEFRIRIETSREFLPLNDSTFPVTRILVPRVWFPYARDFPFNNVGTAFVTLFELLTLEGWTEIRDMFSGRNKMAEAYMQIYIHTFVFFAVNIGLQLFLGIVVNNFNEHKPGHTFLLSVEQNRWADLMQRVSLQRPDKLPLEPRNNKIRMVLYRLLTHHSFRVVPTVIIGLSALTLIVPWDEKVITENGVKALILLSVTLNLYTVLEMLLKLLAFGPAYFQSWRNWFDFILSFATFAYAILGIVAVIFYSLAIHRIVSYFALCLAILKLLTVMLKYSAMLNLLLTVFSTLFRSFSLILVLLIFVLAYALVGVTVFSNLRSGEAINLFLVNFADTGNAMSAIWRSLTGEDWYQIMWDAAVRPPYCNDSSKNCGNPVISVLYFGTFIFIVSFILINVFIAVLLESFSIFYNDEETNLDLAAMKDFKRKWRKFDLNAKGHIPISRVKLLLRSLDLQMYYTYEKVEPGQKGERVIHELMNDPLLLWEMEEELKQEVSTSSKNPSTGSHLNQSATGDFKPSLLNVEFFNVLRMLAYRCEDISKRLEPQELFHRKEQEQTLQLDVAEECILKWLRKHVRPIIDKLKDLQRSQERSQPSPTNDEEKRQRLFSLHNANSQLLNVQGWDQQSLYSFDNEEEEGESNGLSLYLQVPDTSEEQIDYIGIQDSTRRSLNKLKQKYPTSNNNEKAKEWFQMQAEWMEKVKTDENYFDDQL